MLPGLTYPIYSCICPQTGYNFDVRCLTVSEEDRLLQSSTFGYQTIANLNDVIWRCIVNKPDEIQTFGDFCKKITQKDRDALLYSILQASDADEQSFETKCINCGESNSISIKLSECFSANIYEGKPGEILNKRVEVVYTIGNIDIVFTTKAATLADEKNVMLYLKKKPPINVMTMLLITEKIDFKEKGTDKIKQSTNTLQDMEVAIRSLPGRVIKTVRKKYQEEIGKYSMSLPYLFNCSNCGFTNQQEVDLVEVLFRTIAGE